MDLMESMKKTMQIVEDMTAYKELSDSPILEPGNTEIWYAKGENSRDYGMGWSWMKEKLKTKAEIVKMDGRDWRKSPLPDPNNLEATHVKLGTIGETDLNRIYSLMQGENWSPAGEANQLIDSKGADHTSMSVGDIIVVNGNPMFVDDYGFTNIITGKEA